MSPLKHKFLSFLLHERDIVMLYFGEFIILKEKICFINILKRVYNIVPSFRRGFPIITSIFSSITCVIRVTY